MTIGVAVIITCAVVVGLVVEVPAPVVTVVCCCCCFFFFAF